MTFRKKKKPIPVIAKIKGVINAEAVRSMSVKKRTKVKKTVKKKRMVKKKWRMIINWIEHLGNSKSKMKGIE